MQAWGPLHKAEPATSPCPARVTWLWLPTLSQCRPLPAADRSRCLGPHLHGEEAVTVTGNRSGQVRSEGGRQVSQSGAGCP